MESKVKKKVREFLPYCFASSTDATNCVKLLESKFDNKVGAYSTGRTLFVEKHKNCSLRQAVHELLVSKGGEASVR